MNRILILCYLAATQVWMTGCSQSSTSSPSPYTRPFVADYWLDVASQERMELIGVSFFTPSGMTFSYPLSPSGTVRCTILATFNGDVKSGTIIVSSPDQLTTIPSGSDTTLCQWFRSANSYQITSNTLTIFYGSSQARSFTWNGVQ